MKKVVFVINVLAFVITLIIYALSSFVTVKYELYALISQIFLGLIQIVIGLGFFIRWKKHNLMVKRGLLIYWGIVIVYYFMSLERVIDDKIFFRIIPMSIAAYFVGITFLNIKNKADTLSIVPSETGEKEV